VRGRAWQYAWPSHSAAGGTVDVGGSAGTQVKLNLHNFIRRHRPAAIGVEAAEQNLELLYDE
jgi:hypothetical protein